MKSFYTLLLVSSLLLPASASAQSSDPDSAAIVTSDIVNFWKAYDRFEPGMTHRDSLHVLLDYYFLEGSPGLLDFIQARISSVIFLLNTINRHSRFYASIREPTMRAVDFVPQMRQAYYTLDSLYAAAVFPDAYLLIGRLTSGGTFSNSRILIGTEMHARSAQTDMSEMGDWHRQVLKPIEEIPHIVAHELVHYQQKHRNESRSLLSQSLMEGSADYVAEIISGKHINGHVHDWADPREEELWLEFSEKMGGTDYEGWLYGGDRMKDRPADLGYWMGYKIVDYYLERAPDRREAIRDVLEMEDAEVFLEKSGYREKFER